MNDLHCLNLVTGGAAQTPTQLAEHMGLTAGAVTKMLNRMEAARLVRREPDPADRRRVIVRPRRDRLAELAALYEPINHYFQTEIASGTDDQLKFFAGFACRAREGAHEEAARLRREGKAHATRKPRAGPDRAGLGRAWPGLAGLGRAGPGRTGLGLAGPGWAWPGRTGLGLAGLGLAWLGLAGPGWT